MGIIGMVLAGFMLVIAGLLSTIGAVQVVTGDPTDIEIIKTQAEIAVALLWYLVLRLNTEGKL